MAAPVSTAPTVRAYLLAEIAELVDAAVLVSDGPPGPNQPDDIIVIGDVDNNIEIAAVVGDGGQGWLVERYDLIITVSCYRGGDDNNEVFARAAELAGLVVEVVRQDPSLAATVLLAVPERWTSDSSWEASYKGRLVDIDVTIKVTAHI